MCFLLCNTEQAVGETVELAVISEIMKLGPRYCIVNRFVFLECGQCERPNLSAKPKAKALSRSGTAKQCLEKHMRAICQ